MSKYMKWMFIILPLIVAIIPFIPNIWKVAILIFISIFLLATNILPVWHTSLLFVTSSIIGNVASKEVILSGVTSSAVWLILSGIIIGSAIKHTKLDRILARIFLPISSGKFHKVILGTILLGVLLMFVMPSATGRVVLLLPILNALSTELGYEKGSKEWEGILMSGVLATYIPAFYILPSNIPNNIFAGAVSSLYAINISYTDYFLTFFPIFGLGKLTIVYIMMLVFYRNGKDSKIISKEVINISKEQKQLIFLLCITLILWMTEHIHKIPTGWVGMAVSLILMIPNSNFMEDHPLRKVNFEIFFYVAGIISMGNIAKASGLANTIANALLGIVSLSSASVLQVSALILLLCLVLGSILTLAGVPAIVTPLLENISNVTNISKEFLGNIEVIGFSSVFIPFQAPPLMVFMQSEDLSKTKMIMYCSIVSILGLLLIFPAAMLGVI